MKEGWKTTEFWLTLGANLVGVLVLVGVVDPAHASDTEAQVREIVEGGFAAVVILGTIWRYIEGRTRLKEREMLTRMGYPGDVPR